MSTSLLSSSQLWNWTFKDYVEISNIRYRIHETTLKIFMDHNPTRTEQIKDEILSFEEVFDVLEHYHGILLKICAEIELGREVIETSSEYYKRFFVRQSPMVHHPLAVAVGAIFLASKTEEYVINVETLANACEILVGLNEFDGLCSLFSVCKKSEEGSIERLITDYECFLLDTMSYDLVSHNAGPTVTATFNDLQLQVSSDRQNIDLIMKPLLDKAFELVNVASQTDAPFVYTAQSIGFTCVWMALNEGIKAFRAAGTRFPLRLSDFDNHMNSKVFGGLNETEIFTFRKSMEEIAHIIEQQKINMRTIEDTDVLRRLKICNEIALELRIQAWSQEVISTETPLDASFSEATD